MKRHLIITVTFVLMLMLVMSGLSNASDEIYKWDLFTFVAATSIQGNYLNNFAEDVKQKTNGRLLITIRTAGELPYKASDALTIASQGAVELADANTGYVAGESDFAGIVYLPFLISKPELYTTARDIVLPYFNKDIASKGIEVLFIYPWPHSAFWGQGEPILSLNDLKGKKMRGQNEHTSALFTRLGASSVNLSTPEVAPAMQRGIADGMMTSSLSVYTSKWYEFLDWGYLLYSGGSYDYIVVNSDSLQKLPEDIQKILKETANYYEDKMTKEIYELAAGYPDKLRELGMTIVEPKQGDMEFVLSLIKDHWESWVEKRGPEVNEVYMKLREALDK